MNRDSIRDYVGRSEDVLDASPQMDEANTKAAILRDFLDLLDWEIPANTQLEYSVEAFGQTYKVDYALILEGTPVAFLEAKGADTTLTTEHEEQLSSYMTNKNVTYGILTNGKQYRFFQRRVDAANVDVQKVGDVALEDLPDRIAVLKAYEKDAIESGESGKILGRINELREARRTLKAEKDELATELAALLADQVSDTISSLAESQSKEMIDRLIRDIDSEIDANGAESVADQEEIQRAWVAPSEARSEVQDTYSIEIQQDGETLHSFEDGTQAGVLTQAVNYLVENHGVISKIEPLPYIPGRKRAIINTRPKYKGHEMKVPRELEQGYFLETNLSAEQKQREIRRLTEKCGLDVYFRQGW